MEVLVADDLPSEAAAQLRIYLEQRLGEAARASFAVSGGTTPWATLECLARADIPWERVDLYQVDERIVPSDHPARNLTKFRAVFADHVPARLHPMPVNTADPQEAARCYGRSLPERLDVVQLGLGADGHTASLVANDPILRATSDVAITQPYQGQRRMSLTLPPLNRANRIVWIVAGADKESAVSRLLSGDPSIPAARIAADQAVLVVDRAAIGQQPV